MPITSALGQVNLTLEPINNQGMQALLTNASPSASMSLTTQPVTSTVIGARLIVWIMNAPQAGNGTFTIAGLDINGNAITEGPITVPAPNPAAQSAVVGKFEYVTTNIFASVNASGLTTTNLSGTGATITVWGVQAGKYMLPSTSLKAKKKFDQIRPNEFRNILDEVTTSVQGRNVCTLDELAQSGYLDNSLHLLYMLCTSSPTVTLVQPTSSVTLASAKTTSPFSLTTQPVAPGQQLQFVVSGSSGTGTIGIAGKDAAGNAVTETISSVTNGTYTSTKLYSSINTNGITISTITGYSINVSGLATPPSLLPFTAVSGSPLSLSTQPTAPGMGLVIYTQGVGALGTITIAGVDHYGNNVTEVVSIPNVASGTYYTQNIFKSVNASGITVSGLTGGSIWINGTYGYQYVGLPGNTVYSAAVEAFDGVESYIMPFTMLEELTLEFGMEKELKTTAKGPIQDKLIIGDRTGTSLSTNRIVATSQPSDIPTPGWQSLVFIDTATTPTTQFGDLLEAKITLKSPQIPKWTATNSQNYNRMRRKKRSTMFSGKIDLTNVLQVEQYRLNNLQYITFQLIGQAIGGGFSKQWQFQFPCTWDQFDMDSKPEGDSVEASVQGVAQYNAALGGAYKLTVICQTPPIYAN